MNNSEKRIHIQVKEIISSAIRGGEVLTLNFLYFPLPWDARCPKIFKISLKLYPFLHDEAQSKQGML